jgi:hypothetical protein
LWLVGYLALFLVIFTLVSSESTSRIVVVFVYLLPVVAAVSLFNGVVIGWSAIRASRDGTVPRLESGLLAGALVAAGGRILVGCALLGLISGSISFVWLLLVGWFMMSPGARIVAWLAGRIPRQRGVS